MKDAAQFFKVLSDEARLGMLWLLLNHQELCVCDFVEALGITQSKASRHLGTLRNAGLVTDRKDGLWSLYALRPLEDPLARQHLEALRSTLAGRPESSSILARLHGWLEDKNRGVVCVSDGACCEVPARPATRARRPRAEGGSR